MLENRLYIGIIEVPSWDVSSARGDFEPLVREDGFYRVQAILRGRIQVTAPRQRNHPDFPSRGIVRCEMCHRPVTGSWSRGRRVGTTPYHCPQRCPRINISKLELEGLFVEELKCVQPTPGYMRLVKEHVLGAWQEQNRPRNEVA